jgi:hypothetical protein
MTSHNGLFMKKVNVKRLLWLFLSLILVFSFGCEGKKMADPEGMLETRSVEYWKKRLMEKDYQAAYEMEAKKDRLPYEEYQKRVTNAGQLAYLGITAEKVTVAGSKGDVEIKIKYNMPGVAMVLEGSISHDGWVIEKNQWMHVLKVKKHVQQKE